MLIVRIILILVAFILLSVLGWSNTGTDTTVQVFGRTFYDVPVALVMLYSFAFGALLIGLFALVSEIQLRARLYRQRKEMEALTDELRALRNAPLDAVKPAVPAATDGGAS